ncbi:MAG TPA: alpha/beta hydrolase [Caulobacteraceae bacterium]
MDVAAPLYGTDAAPVPEGGLGLWFTGAGGARLRAALFPAKGAARGSVVLSGGRTEPIEKYYEVISELTARGFVVLAHDWRGQGLSHRLLSEPRGHAVGFADFITDYTALLNTFEARLAKPRIAVGHSMGGCLTALVLGHGETRFSAAVLSAPMFGIFTKPTPPTLTGFIAQALTAVGQGSASTPAGQPSTFETNALTHDAGRYARNVGQVEAHPDIGLGPPTWGWLDFAYKAFKELRHGVGITKVQIPVVVVAAGDDAVVDNVATRLVTARFPQGRYVEAPGAFHEVLQETDDIRAVFWREFDAVAAGL